MKKALVTGVTGQDGSYLAELLLEKGYEVHGLVRRASTFNTAKIDHLLPGARSTESSATLYREYGDLSDSSNLSRVLDRVQPDEVYHLGSQSHVRISFDIPEYTADVTGLGTLRLLDAIKEVGAKVKFYQASSSEMFGKVRETPQRETTPFYPRSPYGCAKVFAYWTAVNYRESYNMFVCNGILFNHESPRRAANFVTRKVTRGMSKIALGTSECLYLGNLDAKRDWGYAKDYVEAMWLILQQDTPDDYVIATGVNHSIRELAEKAGSLVGFDLVWEGSGLDEVGIDRKTGKTVIRIDPYFFRPAEVDVLVGDITKAKTKLGWVPKVSFDDLITLMVEADYSREKQLLLDKKW